MKFIISFVFLFLMPLFASAEPLLISFEEMIVQSKNIAIVEFLGWDGTAKNAYDVMQYNLRVERVLWGEVKEQAKWVVGRAQGAVNLPNNTRCLAFINARGEFEWVGKPIKEGQSLEQGSLMLEGFYDYNAYLVSPCLITLSQLEQYIKEKKYSSSIKGHLHFYDNEAKKMLPSPIQLEVNYSFDAKNGGNQSVKTIGYQWLTFKNTPSLRLPAWDEEISIILEPNMVRPLYLRGEVQSLEKDDSQTAFFWLESPEELTYQEFLEYEKNEKHGHISYEIEIITKDQSYPLILSEERGRIGYIPNFKGHRLDCFNMSDSDDRREFTFHYNGGELIIEMEKRKVSNEALKYSREPFIRELKINPVKGKIILQNGDQKSVLGDCELRYKESRFVRNVNYRG